MKRLKFDRYETTASGDVYFCIGKPEEKDIEGVKYIQVTPDFQRAAWIRADSVKKNGTEFHEVHV